MNSNELYKFKYLKYKHKYNNALNNKKLIQSGGDGEYTKEDIERMSTDKEFLKSNLKKDGSALKYGSDEFKDDFELFYIAYNNNKEALQFVSKRISDFIESICTNNNFGNGLSSLPVSKIPWGFNDNNSKNDSDGLSSLPVSKNDGDGLSSLPVSTKHNIDLNMPPVESASEKELKNNDINLKKSQDRELDKLYKQK